MELVGLWTALVGSALSMLQCLKPNWVRGGGVLGPGSALEPKRYSSGSSLPSDVNHLIVNKGINKFVPVSLLTLLPCLHELTRARRLTAGVRVCAYVCASVVKCSGE